MGSIRRCDHECSLFNVRDKFKNLYGKPQAMTTSTTAERAAAARMMRLRQAVVSSL